MLAPKMLKAKKPGALSAMAGKAARLAAPSPSLSGLQQMRPASQRRGGLAAMMKMAHGGPLVSGPGGGQDDMVPAMLSPGEYVIDAETVAALGDGSNEAGAAMLDQMRMAIRKHKRGGALRKIAPPAKHPLQYMRSR
jgi:hypothetical protein